nr:MAG TPA: hypothetical protein [Caudoviricetes sp.]
MILYNHKRKYKKSLLGYQPKKQRLSHFLKSDYIFLTLIF